MVRTRFALILYFRMVAHKAVSHILSKAFFKTNEDMVQILLVLEVLFTQDSEVEGLLLALNQACSSAIISSAWGLSLFKITFSMTLLE